MVAFFVMMDKNDMCIHHDWVLNYYFCKKVTYEKLYLPDSDTLLFLL